MSLDEFIFTPGTWLGEGKITFSSSNEFIRFYTRWKIEQVEEDLIKAVQIVEMHGMPEQLINTFMISDINSASFSVSLENDVIAKIVGKGIRTPSTIAWEFRGDASFEGFEVYERQENGDFFMHAEYGAPDDYRTIVEGLIWPKAAKGGIQ